jgi:cation:H+ antiporter
MSDGDTLFAMGTGQSGITADMLQLSTMAAEVAALAVVRAILALSYRPVSRVWHVVSWASLSLLALYVLNAVLQFMHGH